jgi:hypothetical protein
MIIECRSFYLLESVSAGRRVRFEHSMNGAFAEPLSFNESEV